MANAQVPAEVLDLISGAPSAMPDIEQRAPASQASASPAGGAPEFVTQFLQEGAEKAEFESLPQQALAGLEGAASAATFGLSTGLQKALGVDMERVEKRREYNPGTYTIGQVSSLLLPTGVTGLLGKAGTSAAAAVGLGAEAASAAAVARAASTAKALNLESKAATALAGVEKARALEQFGTVEKIGSSVVKNAVEGALFQAGDEVSKILAKDSVEPREAAGTALANVGLAGLLGGGIAGGIGAVSPLWRATKETELGKALTALSRRAGGIEDVAITEGEQIAANLGVKLSDETRAILSGNQTAMNVARKLEQTDITSSGLKFQETLKADREAIKNELSNVIGKNADEIVSHSPAEVGREAMEVLKKEYEALYKPAKDLYEAVEAPFRQIELPKAQKMVREEFDNISLKMNRIEESVPGLVDNIAEKIAQVADKESLMLEGSPSKGLVQDAIKRVNSAKTVADLKAIESSIGAAARGNFMLSPAARALKNVIADAREAFVETEAGRAGMELLEKYQGAKTAYRAFRDMSDELARTLGIKASGAKEFLINLENKKTPEEILRKLSPKKNAELIPFMEKFFPETLERVRQNELIDLVRPAFTKDGVSSKKLLAAINKASPELRDFVMPKAKRAEIEALATLFDKFDDLPYNYSNTARTASKLQEWAPGSAVAMVSMIAGGGPVASIVAGALTRVLSHDAPDAARLAFLKFMGAKQPINPAGFQAMVNVIENIQKGERLISNAAKGVVRASGEVLPMSRYPTEADRKKADKQLEMLAINSEPLLNVGGEARHYMPEASVAMAESAGAAVQVLNQLRPKKVKPAPFSPEIEPTKEAKARYDRALDIALQPLVIMDSVKNGTVTPFDVGILNQIYPGLVKRLQQKVTQEIIDNEKPVPYRTRMGLSILMGEALDATLMPQAIVSAQATLSTAEASRMEAKAPKSTKNLGKSIQSIATASQRGEMNKA